MIRHTYLPATAQSRTAGRHRPACGGLAPCADYGTGLGHKPRNAYICRLRAVNRFKQIQQMLEPNISNGKVKGVHNYA